MDYLFQDGGKPRNTKSKTGSKTKSSSKTGTKSSTKTSSRTTKSKSSSKKGGNFLGTVGDLVAPTGWGPFATAAGLLALDRADAALRRGKSEKSSAKKMSGGMDPPSLVRNSSGNLVNNWENSPSNEKKLKDLYYSLQSIKDRNSEYYKELFKKTKNLEEKIKNKKLRKQQKEEYNNIIRKTKRFNEKTKNYVQDFIAGIFLPSDDYKLEDDMHFRHVLRNSTGITDEDELTRIIEKAKIARKNRKNRFKTTKATLNSKK